MKKSLKQAKIEILKKVYELTKEVNETLETEPENYETINSLAAEIRGIKYAITILNDTYFKLEL